MSEPRFTVTYRMSGPTEFRVDGKVVARCSPNNDERYQAFCDIARGLNEQDERASDSNPMSTELGSEKK